MPGSIGAPGQGIGLEGLLISTPGVLVPLPWSLGPTLPPQSVEVRASDSPAQKHATGQGVCALPLCLCPLPSQTTPP